MPQTPPALMLFAAGFGRRMHPLTDQRPKPLVKVAGKALIDHALSLADSAGIQRIVANTHYKAEMIADHLIDSAITLSHETPEILETGGGLRAALPYLGPAPVLTLNTDAVWRGVNPLALLQAHWEPEKMDALLLCIPPEQALGHSSNGDFLVADDNHLIRGPDLIFSGAQLLKTEGLRNIPDRIFSLNRLWDKMLAHRSIYGLIYTGLWCDVGRPTSIAVAENMLFSNDV